MKTSMILTFEELFELWKRSRRSVSISQLLGLTILDSTAARDHYVYSLETLRRRFRGTWWEVVWPAYVPGHVITKGVQCKYMGDSPRHARE